ncbi:MAG: YkgJ family cysteine cluster protein [Deltaproteobacteria bacterium]|nr:YkgJ family cysteine cluster protein [Deltaproteobacteria bacterium]
MKNKVPSDKVIQPLKLSGESSFQFLCHKGISCFNKCCSEIRIYLTPYDIVRMKNRLGISSEAFLERYTFPQELEKTDLPVVILKMNEDEIHSCPFVSPDGCTLYTDRPATCRYYPIGFAAMKRAPVKDQEDFYFFIREDHCRGFEEDTKWTVNSWREDQEAELYDRMNREWMEILLRKKALGLAQATDRSLQLFYMVSYDIDSFRRFVFDSSFLEKFKVDPEEVEKMREDDVALLQFGLRWLRERLFGNDAPEPEG